MQKLFSIQSDTSSEVFAFVLWMFCYRSLMEAKLKSGTTLIVDRYSYSGVAFSSAKGLDIQWCKVKTHLVYSAILP